MTPDPILWSLVSCLGLLSPFALVFGFIAFMRYLSYRETIALAEKGLLKPDKAQGNSKNTLCWGIIIAAIGLALSISVYPFGFMLPRSGSNPPIALPLGLGPWMIVGLVPLFIGLGLILIYVLTRQDSTNSQTNKSESENVK